MKTRTVLALCLCLGFAGCTSRSKVSTRPITEERRQLHVESFDVVWNTIKQNHWDPNLNGVDWDAARSELRPLVLACKTDAEARAAMENLISRLKQTHFGIIPAESYKKLDAINDENSPTAGAGEAGVEIRVVDGQALVTKVLPDSPGAKAGVKPGWELVEARGRKVTRLFDAVNEAYKGSHLKQASLSLGCEQLLHGDAGQKISAEFIDGAEKRVKKEIVLEKPAGTPAKMGNLPTFYIRTEMRDAAPDIGYYHFTAFFDPARVNTEFRSMIQTYQNARGIVIDLRGNPGGIGFMANGMAGSLVNQPNLQLGEMFMKQGGFKFIIFPQPVAFSGPVAVLVDEASMSTSEIMAGGLKDLGRARIFGNRTAGAAIPSRVVKLPNGDGFQYGFANYVSNKSGVLEGNGVEPDEVVLPNRADLLAGKDPAVDAAVKWIRSQNAK